MVRPEPDEPFGKTDFGGERRIDARLRFGEINLLRQARPRIGPWRGHRRRLILHLRRAAAAWRHGRLSGAFSLPRRALRLLIGKRHARGHSARQQIWIADAGCARAVQFGEQRAAGIRRDGRD
jgi:hypothetical protein